jgi:uncharacterized protein (TIGR00251 family)
MLCLLRKSVSKPKNHLTVKIKVEPRSSKSAVVGRYGDALKVKLTSPPAEGKANKELIEVLSRKFGINKKDVEIVLGQTSKNKIVKLHGISSLEFKSR